MEVGISKIYDNNGPRMALTCYAKHRSWLVGQLAQPRCVHYALLRGSRLLPDVWVPL